jgi:hypothetical protein
MLQRYEETQRYIDMGDGSYLRAEDFRPPWLRIIQAQSSVEQGKPGQLYRQDTGEAFDHLDVVPLLARPTRTKWPAGGFTRDSKPECWSDNDRHGAPGAAYAGEECRSCTYFTRTPWTAERDSGICMPGYIAVFARADAPDDEDPLIAMRCYGTLAKKARLIMPDRVRRVIRLSTALVEKNVGRWYDLTFERVMDVPEEQQERWRSIVRQFSGRDIPSQDVDEEDDAGPSSYAPEPEAGHEAAQTEDLQAQRAKDAEELFGVEQPRPQTPRPYVPSATPQHEF